MKLSPVDDTAGSAVRPVKPRGVTAVLVAGVLAVASGAVLLWGDSGGDFGGHPQTGVARAVSPSWSTSGGSSPPVGDLGTTVGESGLSTAEPTVPAREPGTSAIDPVDAAGADDAAVSSSPAADTTSPPIGAAGVDQPVRLSMPGFDVDATVEPVSVDDGELAVPPDPSILGWWLASAPAGASSGTIVIGGHVDSAKLGLGVFAHLRELQAGDPVELTTADGVSFSYMVDARQSYPKVDGLPADLFAFGGAPKLVLITCGGSFDHDTGSYADNVAVFASPASGP